MHFIQQAITSEHFELSAKKFVDAYRIALTKVNLYRTALSLLSLLHFDEGREEYTRYYMQELENHIRQIDGTYQTFINYQ
jgi:menaquinone-dependent protoporphyrinogen IX oxidase